jgi:hypothetical protein
MPSYLSTLRAMTLAIAVAGLASAASVTIPANLYGHLNQIGSGICEDGSGNNYACGPVATVNSFAMLDAKYGSSLIPDNDDNGIADDAELLAVAEILAGEDYMKCAACNGGTTVANLIAGKRKYLDEQAPGKYWVHSQYLPDFNWFFDELTAGQDIEVLVGFYNNLGQRIGGHYITLNGISWTDANDDDVVDDGEATIDFIDPSGGVDRNQSFYKYTGQNYYATNYNVGGNVVATVVEWGVAESPVPEPGTVIVMLSGLGLFAARRFRSQQQ